MSPKAAAGETCSFRAGNSGKLPQAPLHIHSRHIARSGPFATGVPNTGVPSAA